MESLQSQTGTDLKYRGQFLNATPLRLTKFFPTSVTTNRGTSMWSLIGDFSVELCPGKDYNRNEQNY